MAGDLVAAAAESSHAALITAAEGPLWALKFRFQQARIAVYQGNNLKAIALLEPVGPGDLGDPALAVTRDSLLALAYARTGDRAREQSTLLEADRRCADDLSRAELRWVEGVIAVGEHRFPEAEQAFERSLASARASGDRFLESETLLNIGDIALRQDHYDEALDHFQDASAVAGAIGARLLLMVAAGNAGATFNKVGDFPHALANAEAAEQQAVLLGVPIDQATWLLDVGEAQYGMGNVKAARASFEHSYRLALTIKDDGGLVDALFSLASLSLQDGDLGTALVRAQEAVRVAEQSGDHASALRPSLLVAMVSARQGDPAGARRKLLDLLNGGTGAVPRPFERWQIESALAHLAGQDGDRAAAETWFQRAIATYTLQRSSVSRIETRLPFIENGTSLYRDYMDELLRDGRKMDALLVLDRSRAATLAEGPSGAVGQSSPGSQRTRSPSFPKDPAALASRLHGTILVYCLRPQTSYLWAISPGGSSFYPLPGKEVLLPLIDSHTQSILAGRDVLAQQNAPGLALYHDLVEPATAQIAAGGGKVYVIADEGLNQLNFETLLVPGSRPHFWIEDVDVVNAKSLSLLAARSSDRQPVQATKKLLLVGDPIYTRAEYVPLPHAAEEVADVAAHFSPDHRLVLTGSHATGAEYLLSHPGEFTYIHFVAHATATELNPLDSAVILSAPPGQPDQYKLYARDILNGRIQADLVTISACFGSGVRNYSGEGLVGLSWAFLRAGSHNVVGALWEVSDVSTPQLMNHMYDGLAAGDPPDIALRSAKLAMIERGGAFRKPFYWAAFQLYSGA